MTKTQKKETVQKELQLEVGQSIPVVIVPFLDASFVTLLLKILEGMKSIGVQLLIVDSNESAWHEQLQEAADQYPGMIRLVSPEDAQGMVADVALLRDLTPAELLSCTETSRVPLACGGLLEPFDPIEERGNGFFYEDGDSWSLFAALVRAVETYRFPYDWKNVLKAAKKSLASVSK